MMQINENEKKQIIDSNMCYVLGTLANDTETYPGVGEENKSVTVMKGSENIVFYIKALSDEPVTIRDYVNPYTPTEPLYIGIDIHQNQSILPIEYKFTSDLNAKIDIIKDKLQNRLILFRPHIEFKAGSPYPYKNLEIINVENDVKVDDRNQFICIPKINMDNKTFEQKLLEGDNIMLEDYNHFMLSPECVLCGDYLYSNFKSWEKHRDNKKVWACKRDQKNIKRVKLTFNYDEMKNKIIRGTDNIIFAEVEYLKQLTDKDGEYIIEPINDTSTMKNLNTEIKFLKNLKQYTIEKHLCYSIKDLVNFHISLKTNPLTIVAGMSGTGKTQLARAYANVLGLSEEDETLLFLPISPSYTEPEDLLGYLNTTNGLYNSAETGLVDFLINAEKNPEKIYMVIFDEMNLSQVEHWFAPFISLLELECDKRKLKLYNKNAICHNCEKYRDSVQVGNNIIFIGTVNIDETTKEFSDRLLDRANIVTLKKESFLSLKKEQDNKDKIYKSSLYSFQEYSSWIKKDYNISKGFTTQELNLLDNLNDMIQKCDDQKGVSFRIFDRIEKYLMNIPKDIENNYTISRADAFDIQIKQRLLTKIKGIDRQLKGLLGTIDDNTQILNNSELYEFFNTEENKNVSDFNLTKKEIYRKSRELGLHGYAN